MKMRVQHEKSDGHGMGRVSLIALPFNPQRTFQRAIGESPSRRPRTGVSLVGKSALHRRTTAGHHQQAVQRREYPANSVSAAVNGASRIALSLFASVIERAGEIRKTSSESEEMRSHSSGEHSKKPLRACRESDSRGRFDEPPPLGQSSRANGKAKEMLAMNQVPIMN
jgi:hypothetical protein